MATKYMDPLAIGIKVMSVAQAWFPRSIASSLSR
jgi:hypothetical protein